MSLLERYPLSTSMLNVASKRPPQTPITLSELFAYFCRISCLFVLAHLFRVPAAMVTRKIARLVAFHAATLAFWVSARAENYPAFGPAYHEFRLTLEPGHRTEAVGPLYYHEVREDAQTWASPPLFSYTMSKEIDYEEFDILYPILSYDRFGPEYRFHIFQVFAFAGGQTQTETNVHRFTLFPIYFQQRSAIPELNYTALLPIYGHLKNRLFRDEVKFVLMPIYVQSRRKDVVTDNYMYPFVHVRHGDGLKGWQFWPIVGHE